MTWKLWLDDQLDDPNTPVRHTPEGFLGARSTLEATVLVAKHGLPEFMDLDFDLGGDDTTHTFLKWLANTYPDGPVPDYRIHSQNVVGVDIINVFLNSWARALAIPSEPPIPWAGFEISAQEGKLIEEFLDTHQKLHKGQNGAIGGRFTYQFTPTSLGLITKCRCACGAEIDVTDYDTW